MARRWCLWRCVRGGVGCWKAPRSRWGRQSSASLSIWPTPISLRQARRMICPGALMSLRSISTARVALYGYTIFTTRSKSIEEKKESVMVVIHPTADVSSEAAIGDGTRIWGGAQVRERAQLGRNCIVGKNAYIDFEVALGD